MKTLNTRSRIILLVVLAAMPALALTVYSTWDERARAEASARQDLRLMARLAAQRQAQIIEGARQTLAALSLIPANVRNDQARCNEYLGKLLEKSPGIYHSMGIYRSDNLLLCNAIPWQGSIFSPDRLYLQLALSTGKFSIGEYQVGRVTKQQGINFAYPIKDAGGNITGAAFVAVDLAWLNRMAAVTPLPQQGVLAIFDRNGALLARHPEAAEQVGQKLPFPHVLQTLLSGRDGVFEAKGRDGLDRLMAYDTVAENPDGIIPIRVLVSIPMNVIFAEANQALVRNLIGLVVATILLLIAAWYGAETFILRKIKMLLAAAARVHSGDLSARTGLRQDGEELSQVAAAFDEMTQALQHRDAELKQALQDLQEQVITDPLTTLLNRRFLQELLPRELLRAKRNGHPLAVIMIDLDHFKRINDTFGHGAGDLVLKELGGLLKSTIRGSDVACRYGGEEFALILPEATPDGARRRAEDIRTLMKGLELNYRDRPLGKITASLGVAMFPDHAEEANALMRAADEALYEAKGAGRDCVVVSPGGTAGKN